MARFMALSEVHQMTEPVVPAAPETPAPPKPETPAESPVPVPAPAAPVPVPVPAPVQPTPPKDVVRNPTALIDSLTETKDRFAKKYEAEVTAREEIATRLAALELEHANSQARNVLLQAGIVDEEAIAALLPGQVAREDPTTVSASVVEMFKPKGVPTTRAPSNGSPHAKARTWQEQLADGVKGLGK